MLKSRLAWFGSTVNSVLLGFMSSYIFLIDNLKGEDSTLASILIDFSGERILNTNKLYIYIL